MLTKQDLQIFNICSNDKSRPVLTGVLFDKVKKGDQWFILLAATDGYRLTEKNIPVDYEPTFSKLILPSKTVKMVCKLLDKDRKLMLNDSQFHVMNTKFDPEGSLERTISIGDTISGEFPGYNHIKPVDAPVATVRVNARYLVDALLQSNLGVVEIELRDKMNSVVVKEGDGDTVVESFVMPLK